MVDRTYSFKAPLEASPAIVGNGDAMGLIKLTERNDIAISSLAVRNSGKFPKPFGLSLPQPGLCSVVHARSALWTGPDQWLLMAEREAHRDFAVEVRHACPGCSVTEQTDAWVVVDIEWENESVFPDLSVVRTFGADGCLI